MGTLHEYFVKDGAFNLTVHEGWSVMDELGAPIGEVTARLHFDFEAGAKYVSFYVPDIRGIDFPEALVLNNVDQVLAWPNTKTNAQKGYGNEVIDGRDLKFTGRIFLYSERPIPEELRSRMFDEAARAGHAVIVRSQDYVQERDKWQRPRAFISHDHRDKKAIAEPLALALLQAGCPVWYDQFSLTVGDSLRESIELGLRECRRCVLILTPNFLSNTGWGRKEYDSIFTRELVEAQKVILPVWHDVTKNEVYGYSPSLADRYAAIWSEGIDKVVHRLLQAIPA